MILLCPMEILIYDFYGNIFNYHPCNGDSISAGQADCQKDT